jgi:hypothetical protein
MGKPGRILMPRRPAIIEPDIPLYLVPHIVMRGVWKHGEGLERIIVSRNFCHFYNISIRRRPIKRELKGRHPSPDAPEARKRGKRGERE